MTYVLRHVERRKAQYNLTDELAVRYPYRLHDTGRTIGGLFHEFEPVGVDTNRLEVVPAGFKGTNSRGHSPWRFWVRVKCNLLDVKAAVRELQDDDAAAIADVDARIEGLKRQINDLRQERHDAVVRGWRRGRTVPLPVLVDKAESDPRARKARA